MACAAAHHPLNLAPTQAQFQFNPGADAKSTRAPVTVVLLGNMSAGPSSPYQKSGDASDWGESSSQLPRAEPFSRSRISRLMREPTLLEKAQHALSDRCLVLEGEDAYRCWEALFEFENIKETCEMQCNAASPEEKITACRPLERLENMVRQSNGVSSLMQNVRMLATMHKASVDNIEVTPEKLHQITLDEAASNEKPETGGSKRFPESGGLPPTKEELELKQSAMMPESAFTRMLRRRGRPASWYTHPPQHETD